MTKPDDIDHDAWEKAIGVELSLFTRVRGAIGDIPNLVAVASIARAIMSARAEEREACAIIAEDEDGARPGWGEHRNMVVAQQVAQEIAAAIRNRP